MIEIRFHGRGGQGAVTAAEILAKAAFEDGNTVKHSHFSVLSGKAHQSWLFQE
jgi:Pyruvate:ferredoxin oxidoreductase and related 2-oxoacid:ferredoxin oxidoreductases, gamma subunit